MSEEKNQVLPVKAAYAFGADHGLEHEMNDIRTMQIGWDLSYTTTVRRGYIVELFEQRHILEQFNAKHWPEGNTTWGQKECERYLRIKMRFDDFLEGRAPAPQEPDQEPEQQFAAESDLRD